MDYSKIIKFSEKNLVLPNFLLIFAQILEYESDILCHD